LLLKDPPTDAEGLFECYDMMITLADKHAPFADVKIRSHHNAPWYDNECRSNSEVSNTSIGAIYRDKKVEPNRPADQTSAFRLQQEVRSLLVSG